MISGFLFPEAHILDYPNRGLKGQSNIFLEDRRVFYRTTAFRGYVRKKTSSMSPKSNDYGCVSIFAKCIFIFGGVVRTELSTA